MNDIKIWAHQVRRPAGYFYEVMLYHETPEGNWYYPPLDKSKTILVPECSTLPEGATLQLTQREVAEMYNYLSSDPHSLFGAFSFLKKKDAGELEATKKHLADMQRLVMDVGLMGMRK